MPKSIKIEMLQETVPNLGIITSYNDMVSAPQPFKDFPDQIKDEAQKNGATVQVAGGTPPCATVLPKAMPVWNCRCSPAT